MPVVAPVEVLPEVISGRQEPVEPLGPLAPCPCLRARLRATPTALQERARPLSLQPPLGVLTRA
eukprot:2832548-Alexandrium_andersonii.AAC.1